ncbi:TetR/AcrR family transcriptional regulator [Geodermatophilus marinus]|nr:TetR/AcrR family transcriptional regulator [Geodermatophilus sp. LHW52908]
MVRTRAGLLEGAARAFAERGLRRSTMQSLAAAAGVAKGTLYNHFRTKDDVALALLAAELDRLGDLAAGRPSPGAAVAALAEEVAEHPVLRRLAVDEPAALAAVLAPAPEGWAAVVTRLAGVLGTDPVAAAVVARWLVSLVLQPGCRATRQAEARRLAALVTGGPAVPGP